MYAQSYRRKSENSIARCKNTELVYVFFGKKYKVDGVIFPPKKIDGVIQMSWLEHV
jgi:hypothetical protein